MELQLLRGVKKFAWEEDTFSLKFVLPLKN